MLEFSKDNLGNVLSLRKPVGTLIAENWHPDLEQFRPQYRCRPAPRVLALSSWPLFQASRRTFLRLLKLLCLSFQPAGLQFPLAKRKPLVHRRVHTTRDKG